MTKYCSRNIFLFTIHLFSSVRLCDGCGDILIYEGVNEGDGLSDDWDDDDWLRIFLKLRCCFSPTNEVWPDCLGTNFSWTCLCVEETLCHLSPWFIGPLISLNARGLPGPWYWSFELRVPSSPEELDVPRRGELLLLVGGLPLLPPVPLFGLLGPIFSPRKSNIGEVDLLLSNNFPFEKFVVFRKCKNLLQIGIALAGDDQTANFCSMNRFGIEMHQSNFSQISLSLLGLLAKIKV